MIVNGATRLYIIVGDPIAQVQAPGGMTQAFSAMGRNAVLVPVHIAPADLADFLKAVSRVQNLDGIVVTIPHKFACYEFCSSATDRAHFLGAVNNMRRAVDGDWYGEMLDGPSFVGALRAKGCKLRGCERFWSAPAAQGRRSPTRWSMPACANWQSTTPT